MYSYDEDDMVEDPKIKEHLAYFGIEIGNMEKVRPRLLCLICNQNAPDASKPG